MNRTAFGSRRSGPGVFTAALLVLIATAAGFCAGRSAAEAEPSQSDLLAIVDVNVIPMTTDDAVILKRQTVVIEDGTIVAIDDAIEPPDGATVINGRRRYLMPGLADLHVHLWYPGMSPRFSRQDVNDLLLAAGVTTVFDMGAFSGILEWRAQNGSGELQGPRIYSASNAISNTNQPSVDAVERAVLNAAANGFDAIKAYNPLDFASYARLLETASSVGIRVLGHSPQAGHSMRQVAESGQDLIAHAQEILHTQFPGPSHPFHRLDEAVGVAELMTSNGQRLTATLEIFELIGRITDDDDYARLQGETWLRYVPGEIEQAWRDSAANNYRNPANGPNWNDPAWWAERTDFLRQLTFRLWDNGVELLIGTDAGGIEYALLGRTIHDELEEHARAGIPNYAVLQAATVNAVRYLGDDHQRGTVETGKSPDLILVKGNPVRKLKRLRKLEGVLVHGQWISGTDLRGRLDRLAEKFQP